MITTFSLFQFLFQQPIFPKLLQVRPGKNLLRISATGSLIVPMPFQQHHSAERNRSLLPLLHRLVSGEGIVVVVCQCFCVSLHAPVSHHSQRCAATAHCSVQLRLQAHHISHRSEGHALYPMLSSWFTLLRVYCWLCQWKNAEYLISIRWSYDKNLVAYFLDHCVYLLSRETATTFSFVWQAKSLDSRYWSGSCIAAGCHLWLFQVGWYLKNPKYPIWLLGSETHLTVLFSLVCFVALSLIWREFAVLYEIFIYCNGLNG